MSATATPSALSVLDLVGGPSTLASSASTLKQLAPAVRADRCLQQHLLDIVLATRSDVSSAAAHASANAISVLVAAGVSLARADLSGCKFPSANLIGADFDHAVLDGADLSNSLVGNACFDFCSLRGSRMEGLCVHAGPESVVVRTESHAERITTVAYSHDGRYIASGSSDKTVRVWDADKGTCCATLTDHPLAVSCVAFSPCGTYLASGAADATVRVWDWARGTCTAHLTGHEGAISSLSFSLGSRWLASCSMDGACIVWNVTDGTAVTRQPGAHKGPIRWCAFSPRQCDLLATGGADKALRLWTRATADGTWTKAVEVTDLSDGISCLCFSPDGAAVLTGSDCATQRTLNLFSVEDGRELGVFPGHFYYTCGLSFSPDGRFILSGFWDGSVRIWNVARRAEVLVLKGNFRSVTSVAFRPNSRQYVTGSWDSSVRTWDAENGAGMRLLRLHDGNPVMEILPARLALPESSPMPHPNNCFLPSLVSIAADGSVAVTDAGTFQLLKQHRLNSEPENAASVTSTSEVFGDGCIAVGFSDGSVRVVSLLSGALRCSLCDGGAASVESLQAVASDDSSVVIRLRNHDGSHRAFSCSEKFDKIQELQEDTPVALPHRSRATSGAYEAFLEPGDANDSNVDGSIVVVEHDAAGAVLMRKTVPVRGLSVRCLRFAADGDVLVGGTDEGAVLVWEQRAVRPLLLLSGHTAFVRCCIVSDDGNVIASCGDDSTVRVWDAHTGAPIALLDGVHHRGGVDALAISSDATRIASGGVDGLVVVWDLRTRRPVCECRGHEDKVLSVCFRPDGAYLASCGRDMGVRLWNASTGECVNAAKGHSAAVRLVTFSPDGHFLASSSEDKTIRLWTQNLESCREIRLPDVAFVIRFSVDSSALVSFLFFTTLAFRCEDGSSVQGSVLRLHRLPSENDGVGVYFNDNDCIVGSCSPTLVLGYPKRSSAWAPLYIPLA